MVWILVIVIFFTFSAAKQDLYIFPIVPAVAALAGLFIARRDDGSSPCRARSASRQAVIGLLLAVAGAGTFYIFETVKGLRAARRRIRWRSRGGWRNRGARVRASIARAPRSWSFVSLVTLNWAFIDLGSAKFRTLQTGSSVDRGNSEPPLRGRRRRTTTSRSRAWCITSDGTSRSCSIARRF